MPIIIHTKDKSLADISFNTDENRKLLSGAPKNIKFLGESVCAILHQRDLVPNKGDFKIRSDANTLDTTIRNQVSSEINQKNNEIINAYPNTFNTNGRRAELRTLPWPDTKGKGLTDYIKFKDLQCPAQGTGFYVGNNLVITAAHCVTWLDSGKMHEYRLVFNFKDTANVPAANVFSIRRVIYHNALDRAQAAPNAPVIPPSTKSPVHERPVNLAARVQDAQTYDVAILEIIATGSGPKLPKPLVLQRKPAEWKTPVYSIGCSNGLPLIYADGSNGRRADRYAATVRSKLNLTLPLARQGSLTADIDVFKGNSGGPLFNENTDEVVGICRSGMISPWLSDTTTPGVKNSTLKGKVEKLIETEKHSNGLPFEPDYLDYYDQLRTVNDNTRLSWIRFKGDSGAITCVNAFSRTDPYALLTMPLGSFLDDIKGHLSIDVEISAALSQRRMKGDITLVITGATGVNTHGSTLKLDRRSRNGDDDDDLKWYFTSNAANHMPPLDPLIGTLANDLLPWAGGICSWKSIGLTRSQNTAGEHEPDELEPTDARIKVQFWLPDPDHHGQCPHPFIFQIKANKFTKVAGTNDSWTSPLGVTDNNTDGACWFGPI